MTFTCAKCGATRETKTDRVPSGWKRKGEATYCGGCWRTMYVLRAVTIPVVSPLSCSWDEFGAILREQWAAVTRACNWMLTEMYTRDDRSRDKGKLQPMPKVYLYPETRRIFPTLQSSACAALEQAVSKKYRAARYELIWTCSVSLPTYRYPTPFPVPGKAWSIEMENGCPIISARIGDARQTFRLRGGHEFRRQLASAAQIVSGEAEQGQLDLYRQGKTTMCKMVAWLPRRAAETKVEGTLFVRSDVDALIVALNAKDDRLWTYHGDQVRRWSAEHRKFLQRLADDSKAEHRPTPPFTARREAAAVKYRHRMASATHQISAMIVGYAQRRKFARIQYDDTVEEFCTQFPWFSLRAKLEEKCQAARIEFEHVTSTPVEENSPQPLSSE